MLSKLQVDGPAIGDHRDQFAYIYAMLEQTPQSMVTAFFKKGAPDGMRNPNLFLYLVDSYADPNIEQRAISRLETMRQGERENFISFSITE